jgi:hypothetical protein
VKEEEICTHVRGRIKSAHGEKGKEQKARQNELRRVEVRERGSESVVNSSTSTHAI